MRIIAGLHRSRLLTSPPGTATRPTSDRLRETLFNILASRIAGSRFVDLFAGTGAVGIEALSRGAAHVWFAENAPPALKALRANLRNLRISGDFALEDRGVMPLLQRVAKLPQPIDIVFLDPPYDAEEAYTQTLGFLGSAANRAILAAEAIVIAEFASKSKFQLAEKYGTLARFRIYKQGDTSLAFYRPTQTTPEARNASNFESEV
jgi:16S rRNA (guanine(966)-N(2))-methyltransferase RsmD